MKDCSFEKGLKRDYLIRNLIIFIDVPTKDDIYEQKPDIYYHATNRFRDKDSLEHHSRYYVNKNERECRFYAHRLKL